MEYKRNFGGEIIGIIFAFIALIVIMVSLTSIGEGGSDDLTKRSEEAKLSEKPMTVSRMESNMKAFGLDSGDTDETPEERQERLQKSVDFYNERLASEQESIRRVRQSRQREYGQLMLPAILLLGGFILIYIVSAILKSQESFALKISDNQISIKKSVFQEALQLDLSRIDKIEYEIVTRYLESENRRYRSRMLYFIDVQGNILEKLDLNEVSGADFNQIQKEISQRAPHIEWIYPH